MGKGEPSKSAGGKLIYQAPKLISLGEPDTGFGQGCMYGSKPPGTSKCQDGAGPGAKCQSGNIGISNCNTGFGV
jgi:hypothetical protein